MYSNGFNHCVRCNCFACKANAHTLEMMQREERERERRQPIKCSNKDCPAIGRLFPRYDMKTVANREYCEKCYQDAFIKWNGYFEKTCLMCSGTAKIKKEYLDKPPYCEECIRHSKKVFSKILLGLKEEDLNPDSVYIEEDEYCYSDDD